MTQHSTQQESLEARLSRLEKENRRFKRIAAAGLLPVACLLLMGQAKKKPKPRPATNPPAAAPETPKSLTAEEFILKDSNGKVRAELSMSGTGPALKLRNEAGIPLVNLALNDSAPSGPLLMMSDGEHHAAISLSVLDGNGSQISVIGERPDVQVHLGVAPDGTSMEVSDKEGYVTTIGNGLVPGKNGKVKKTTAASVVLYGKDRKMLWSTPQ